MTSFTDESQWSDLIDKSKTQSILIFKHSTRCPISSYAFGELKSWINSNPEEEVFYVDVIQYRSVSNLIALKTGIRHESPQALLILNGKVEAHESYYSITEKLLNKWFLNSN